MLTRRRVVGLFAAAGVALATSCGGSPTPGEVDVTITTTPDINPDPAGRPSPVVLRVYQLTAGTKFQAADFFQLFDKESATLGPELLGSEEVTVPPGSTREVTVALKPNAQLIGIAVSFRDIDRASWRALIDVPPNKKTALNAEVKKLEVTLAKPS
jgi:type VI secretion system protein VasD